MACPKIVRGSQRFQRNAGNMIAVQKLLEAEEQHGNGDEVSRDGRHDVRAALSPGIAEAGGQRQRAAAEGRFPQRDGQNNPILQMSEPAGMYISTTNRNIVRATRLAARRA